MTAVVKCRPPIEAPGQPERCYTSDLQTTAELGNNSPAHVAPPPQWLSFSCGRTKRAQWQSFMYMKTLAVRAHQWAHQNPYFFDVRCGSLS